MSEYRKKLIEVALPLEAINRESARENYIYRGNPSAVHKWWAQRPLATCRAVLFASLVDDPSSLADQFPTEDAQEQERQRLFQIIGELVKWENINNEHVLNAARTEIRRSCDGNPPPVQDLFCGGGSIPLEAQRLGLEAYASDLNPVAVLITKALVEIPSKFAGQSPVNPVARERSALSTWQGVTGLTEDVCYYGQWMRDEAEKHIGHLYPKVQLPPEQGGGETPVIAWLWARTVKCPNPACGTNMPLVHTFALSTKKGKEMHVAPMVSGNTYRFEVKMGSKPPGGTVNRRGARCICCDSPVSLDHVRTEAKAGRMGEQLMAIVAEGKRGRTYLPPTEEHVRIAASAQPAWVPETELPAQALGFRVQGYGMTHHADLFTPRQLVALTTFSDLVLKARARVFADARSAGLRDDKKSLDTGGTGAQAYADAVATYLAFSLDKTVEYSCTIVPWYTKEDRPKGIFARQAIPMVWDFAEVNLLGEIGGTFQASVRVVSGSLDGCCLKGGISAVRQADATATQANISVMGSTDPPYYDNIGYADLSDFFYAWLRPTLKTLYPKLFETLQVPKRQELIATPFRFDGNRDAARSFFEEGLSKAFTRMREVQDSRYPLTVYYAFKQSEAEDDTDIETAIETQASTGWETMLEGLLKAGFSIHGTWPMRTERSARSRNIGSNALASSIVLVCRPRPVDAPIATRRELIASLKRELPDALRRLQHGNIAPVDLAQAAIGPGMAIFSRYSKVLEADGSPLPVRTALQLINQALDNVLAEQEGEYDTDTRWTLAWFSQMGMQEGLYGDAETLSKAKNTSVAGLEDAGILVARGGKVRLLRRDELPENWEPAKDKRISVWEATQHLIYALEKHGESGAAALLMKLADLGERARDLAYRLYTTCERKGWTQEALAYNGLVVAWPQITALAASAPRASEQLGLFAT